MRPAGSCTKAHGRSSPDGASPTIRAGDSRTACWSSISRVGRPAVVDAVARHGPQPADRQHPRPLQRDRYVPEGHRAFRRLRSICPEDDHLVGGHLRGCRHPAPGQCAALLHSEHHARRRQRRIQREHFRRRAPTARATTGTGQPRSGPIPSRKPRSPTCCASRCATGSRTARRLPASKISDAGERQPRRSDAGGDGIPERRSRRTRVDLPSGELRQPGVRLRLGSELQRIRCDREIRPTPRRPSRP